MNLEEWKSQIKRGTLEFAILLMIQEKACYGYEIMTRLEEWPMLAAKESTVYPLLRRLLKEGCLSAYWQETAEGVPPRKYYAITEQGKEYLAAIRQEWKNLLEAIEGLQRTSDG